ncbi:MAG: hypothetical protein K0Q60_1847, partial [Microvirga sp.]|nr:hypothetical protein [Microvirga sp.]
SSEAEGRPPLDPAARAAWEGPLTRRRPAVASIAPPEPVYAFSLKVKDRKDGFRRSCGACGDNGSKLPPLRNGRSEALWRRSAEVPAGRTRAQAATSGSNAPQHAAACSPDLRQAA